MPDASWHLREGDTITAELTAVRKLGGGSAYEAWLAFDDVTYAPVVVKLVRPDQVDDEGTLRGLRREVESLALVNHPSVVRGLRHRLDGPRPHVVLEQVDGPRLSTLVRRYGPLQAAQYLPLAIDVASALHYFRHVGLVHLDIKPSNIIMGSPARLIDLSVARSLERATALRQPIGTDDYMSPEQCDPGRDGHVPGHPSDVWGLGATLFEAVAGRRAFPDCDQGARLPDEHFPQLRTRPDELPGSVPAPVVAVVTAALERGPEDRPMPHEIADALEPVLAALPRGHLAGFRIRA